MISTAHAPALSSDVLHSIARAGPHQQTCSAVPSETWANNYLSVTWRQRVHLNTAGGNWVLLARDAIGGQIKLNILLGADFTSCTAGLNEFWRASALSCSCSDWKFDTSVSFVLLLQACHFPTYLARWIFCCDRRFLILFCQWAHGKKLASTPYSNVFSLFYWQTLEPLCAPIILPHRKARRQLHCLLKLSRAELINRARRLGCHRHKVLYDAGVCQPAKYNERGICLE